MVYVLLIFFVHKYNVLFGELNEDQTKVSMNATVLSFSGPTEFKDSS